MFKTYPQIINAMMATVAAESDLTDFERGSINRSLLEAAALQDAEQYIQIAKLRDLYSIFKCRGDDLDRRMEDFAGLIEPRQSSTQSLGTLRVGDSRVSMKKNGTTATLLTAASSTSVNVTFADGVVFGDFPSTGTLIFEREDTDAKEYKAYTSKSGSNTFNFATAIVGTHAIGSTVVLSQQGSDASITSLSRAYQAATADTAQVDFETTEAAVLRDGDAYVDIAARSRLPGLDKNVAAGKVTTFASKPFPTATITNPAAFYSGRDREEDDAFVERALNDLAGLAKSTKVACENAAAQVEITTTGQRVITAQAVEPVVSGDPAYLYIDDGEGFTPSTVAVEELEILLQKAEAGQTRAQIENWPLVAGSEHIFAAVQSGAQPTGTATISVDGVDFTHDGMTFAAGLIGFMFVDSNGDLFEIIDADGSDTIELDGTAATPIAGENYFIFDPDTALVRDTDYSINNSTGAVEFLIELSDPTDLDNAAQGVVLYIDGADPAYSYYDGLVQEVQKVINGVPSDLTNYPGVKALGTTVIVTTPNVITVPVSVGITAPSGVAEDTLVDAVAQAIADYINGLHIGENVILAEIIRVSQDAGAADTRVLSPTSNVTILDGQLARTSVGVITVT